MDRLGAAVALLFVQGWRVSEVLGLAWEDLDLDAGVAIVRRAAVYVDKAGVVLGPTKNAGAAGTHHLSPGIVELLRARRKAQAIERLATGEGWPSFRYEGRPVSPVFTKVDGGLVNRQQVAKAITRAAERAGIDPAGLATHTGRRTAVTVLYAEAGLDLCDIAEVRRSRGRGDDGRLRAGARRAPEGDGCDRRSDAGPDGVGSCRAVTAGGAASRPSCAGS